MAEGSTPAEVWKIILVQTSRAQETQPGLKIMLFMRYILLFDTSITGNKKWVLDNFSRRLYNEIIGGESMAEASDKKGILLQNLQDAGCDTQTIGQCVSLAEEKQQEQLLSLLANQKRTLLERVHKNQDRIDCLDFLIYQIEHGAII
ncbi:hypothetical protein NE619_14185 [Anaerovorax odorimutans]|uniref:Uncharacterized protein n=1 Tax=Anaerovorax odorimutans TaxID=109327 RepID=A0ABT1RRQ4_9FIRM|nr:hypothetical protein [Anaerovorax odorimutans]MCQ4637880.1 hypothetical protein [Anaerovorax odorimutans]